MPQPGDVRKPEFQRGTSLAYGQATQANRQTVEPEMQPPATPEEQFLYSPTFRPDEPVTQGAPVGPGTNYVMRPQQSDQQVLERIATAAASSPFANNPEVKGFIEKVRKGL